MIHFQVPPVLRRPIHALLRHFRFATNGAHKWEALSRSIIHSLVTCNEAVHRSSCELRESGAALRARSLRPIERGLLLGHAVAPLELGVQLPALLAVGRVCESRILSRELHQTSPAVRNERTPGTAGGSTGRVFRSIAHTYPPTSAQRAVDQLASPVRREIFAQPAFCVVGSLAAQRLYVMADPSVQR